MKTNNYPVKLECFGLRNFQGNVDQAVKELIGYILIPVRNIPSLPVIKAIQQKPRWHKLIGLTKEWRPHRPELLMSVLITEREFTTVDRTNISEIQEVESASIIIEDFPCMLTSQKGIFIRLLHHEGLLQVGNVDTNCDVFSLSILLKNIRNLDSVSKSFVKLNDPQH